MALRLVRTLFQCPLRGPPLVVPVVFAGWARSNVLFLFFLGGVESQVTIRLEWNGRFCSYVKETTPCSAAADSW